MFTKPGVAKVATVGLTEKQMMEKGYIVKTSVLPLDAVPRALVSRETTGVKTCYRCEYITRGLFRIYSIANF